MDTDVISGVIRTAAENNNSLPWFRPDRCEYPACCCPAGGGKTGPGRRLGLLLGEAETDGAELHAAAHPHPAVHLRGRRLEGLLLVHRARRRQSRGTIRNPEPTLVWRSCSGGWRPGFFSYLYERRPPPAQTLTTLCPPLLAESCRD